MSDIFDNAMTTVDEAGNEIKKSGVTVFLASRDEIEEYKKAENLEVLPNDGFEDFCKLVGGSEDDIVFLEDKETGEKAGYIEENVGAALMKVMAECLKKKGWTDEEVQDYLRNGSEA